MSEQIGSGHATPADMPLAGIKVLDLTHAAAGPICSMLLADFGAKVLKIEKPGRGDGSRHMRMTGTFADPKVGSDYYLGLNRNKLSVCIDISTEEGGRLCRELASRCDILVQNYRPGVLAKLGLDYQALASVNPGLIYCNVSAFPSEGPLARLPGMDIVVQARAGTIAITGHRGGEPIKPGPSLADLSGGLQALSGVLLALRVRDNTGRGQQVSVNLFHATLMMLANYSAVVLNTDEDIEPMGSGHPQLAPYQAFQASDRWLFVAVGTNDLWRRFCDALGLAELRSDPRFTSNWKRVQHKAELIGLLEPVFRQNTASHWFEMFDRVGVPASPIVTPKEAYLGELECGSLMISTVDHPDYGPIHLPGLSIQLEDTPGGVRRYPPRLGEDTRVVLSEMLGLSDAQLDGLEARQVIEQYAL
jgi:crotonobetainyl-CoA:carnitine CoA-transferase CaiB-like acyl-CoA transferase